MPKGKKKTETSVIVLDKAVTQPTGHSWTGKHPGGRPSKYDPKYCQELIDFFDVPYIVEIEVPKLTKFGAQFNEKKVIPNPPPQLAKFAHKLNISRNTLYEWGEKHPEFQYALTRARELAEAMIVSNTTIGLYNPIFTQLVMKNCFGWKDKNELSTDPKSPLSFVIQKEDEDL